MGHDKNQDQAALDRGQRDNPYQGVGSQGKGQGQERGQGLNKGRRSMRGGASTGGWSDQAHREMQQGDRTMPAQPDGSTPLDKDEHAINKTRPVQQNR